MSSVFDPFFVPSRLENDARDHIRDWIATYLREVTRQQIIAGEFDGDMTDIPTPKSILSRNEFVKFPEDNLPSIVVINSGVVDEPMPDGEGIYGAWWALGIGCVVSASTEDATRTLAQIYGAAIRGLMIQKQKMNGNPYQTQWVDEVYDDMPIENQTRTLRTVRLVFRVWVDGVVSRWGGPAAPDPPDPVTQPGSQWPTADDVIVDTNIVGLNEEVDQ